MRLKHIEVFNAVMLSGSISGAARILNVTQPAVTQTLQHAEQQLGYALFARERSGLKPTEEALQLYARSRQIFEQVDELRRLAQSLKGASGRPLRVGVVPSLSTRHLATALHGFRAQHPQCDVALKILHSDEICRAVALQECDLGIVYDTASLATLHAETLAAGRLLWVEAAGAVEAAGVLGQDAITIAEIVQRDFIGIDKDDPVGRVLQGHLSLEQPLTGTRLSAQTYQSALLLTLSGLGPCIVDSFTVDAAAGQGLRAREIVPAIAVTVSAVALERTRQRPACMAFVAAFRSALQGAAAAPR